MEISQDKKLVVMQLLPALESGGVERGTVDIAKALKKAGCESIVASNGGVMVYQLREAGIKHIELPLHSKNPITIYSNNRKIAHLIKEHQVDVVHVRSRATMWSSYFACKKTKTKLVSTVHGTYSLGFGGIKSFRLKKLYNSVMLKADAVIAVSDFIKNYLIENYGDFVPKNIAVIQRGVDLSYFDCEKVSKSRIVDLSKKWNLPEDKKIILMPARFTSWKGHEFLIESLSKINRDFFCIMTGSDHGHKKFREEVEDIVIEKGLEGRVRIVDACRDMPAAYAISHLVVCPSVRPEAFGRIAIEAQASSRIIISTKIGGSLETVIDGKTGFLVEVENIEQMAKTIESVLEMPKEEANKIGAEARRHVVENFSNEKMCAETIAIYRKVADWELL